MRTLTSNDDMSIESESCKIPISVKAQSMMRTPSGGGFSLSKSEFSVNKSSEDIDMEDDGMTSNRPIPQREVLINYSSGYPELDSDIGPSELSDIAEEPEEGLTSEDGSRGSTPKIINSTAANQLQQQASAAASITRWSSSGLYSNSSQNSLNSKNSTSMTSFATIEQQAAESTSKPSEGLGFSVTKVDQDVLEDDAGILTRPIPQRENQVIPPQLISKQPPTINSNNNVNNVNTTSSTTTTISTNATTKVQINGGTSINQNNITKPKLKIRIFVALFDYDPPTMSPNPDACDEELPFREGQLIKVYGDKDAGNYLII